MFRLQHRKDFFCIRIKRRRRSFLNSKTIEYHFYIVHCHISPNPTDSFSLSLFQTYWVALLSFCVCFFLLLDCWRLTLRALRCFNICPECLSFSTCPSELLRASEQQANNQPTNQPTYQHIHSFIDRYCQRDRGFVWKIFVSFNCWHKRQVLHDLFSKQTFFYYYSASASSSGFFFFAFKSYSLDLALQHFVYIFFSLSIWVIYLVCGNSWNYLQNFMFDLVNLLLFSTLFCFCFFFILYKRAYSYGWYTVHFVIDIVVCIT